MILNLLWKKISSCSEGKCKFLSCIRRDIQGGYYLLAHMEDRQMGIKINLSDYCRRPCCYKHKQSLWRPDYYIEYATWIWERYKSILQHNQHRFLLIQSSKFQRMILPFILLSQGQAWKPTNPAYKPNPLLPWITKIALIVSFSQPNRKSWRPHERKKRRNPAKLSESNYFNV